MKKIITFNIFLIATLFSCKKDVNTTTPVSCQSNASQDRYFRVINDDEMMVFDSHEDLTDYIAHIQEEEEIETILQEQADEGFQSYHAVVDETLTEYGEMGDNPDITLDAINDFVADKADIIEITEETFYEKMPPSTFRYIVNGNRQFAIQDTIFTIEPDSIYSSVSGMRIAATPTYYKEDTKITYNQFAKTTQVNLAPWGSSNIVTQSTNCGSGNQKWKLEVGVGTYWGFLYGAGYSSTWEYGGLTVKGKHFKRGAFGRWYSADVWWEGSGQYYASWVSGGYGTWSFGIGQKNWSKDIAQFYFWKCNSLCPTFSTSTINGAIQGSGKSFFGCQTLSYNFTINRLKSNM